MKYFTFLATVLILLSCSQENTIDESLNIVSEKTNQNTNTENSKKYVGVFGHNTNKELHGKIAIYKTPTGIYEAEINLVNGVTYLFTSIDSLQKNTLIFKGDKGSFNVDINDPNNPQVSQVYINSKTPGYIKLIKKNKNIVQVVALGNYSETGNEANFYGNWDLIGEFDTGTNLTNQFGPELTPYDITKVIISHRDSENLLEDNSIESYEDPIDCTYINEYPRVIMTACGTPTTSCFVSLSSHNQISFFANHEVQWQIECEDPLTYYDSNCEVAASGTWTWNSKTGTINYVETMVL